MVHHWRQEDLDLVTLQMDRTAQVVAFENGMPPGQPQASEPVDALPAADESGARHFGKPAQAASPAALSPAQPHDPEGRQHPRRSVDINSLAPAKGSPQQPRTHSVTSQRSVRQPSGSTRKPGAATATAGATAATVAEALAARAAAQPDAKQSAATAPPPAAPPQPAAAATEPGSQAPTAQQPPQARVSPFAGVSAPAEEEFPEEDTGAHVTFAGRTSFTQVHLHLPHACAPAEPDAPSSKAALLSPVLLSARFSELCLLVGPSAALLLCHPCDVIACADADVCGVGIVRGASATVSCAGFGEGRPLAAWREGRASPGDLTLYS